MQVTCRGTRELEGLSCGLETCHQPWFPILGSSSPSPCQLLLLAVSLGAKPTAPYWHCLSDDTAAEQKLRLGINSRGECSINTQV